MSHLSTLIERVRRIENDGKDERYLQDKVLNIAEYMTWSHDYSEQEAQEARGILQKYEMDSLVGNSDEIENYLNLLYPRRNGKGYGKS